jgi:hypothetical protein
MGSVEESCGYESVIGKEGKVGEGGGLCSREAGASGRFAWILGKVAVQCDAQPSTWANESQHQLEFSGEFDKAPNYRLLPSVLYTHSRFKMA